MKTIFSTDEPQVDDLFKLLNNRHSIGSVYRLLDINKCGDKDIVVCSKEQSNVEGFNVYYLKDIYDKECAIIHDFGNNWTRYAHPDVYEAEFTELCTGKKKEVDNIPKASDVKQTECIKCHHFFTGRTCNYCGHQLEKHTEFVDGQIIKFEHGKMVEVVQSEVSNKKQKKQLPNKQEFYSGLIHEIINLNMNRAKKGKPPVNTFGFAAHKYKEVFGVWPRRLTKTSVYNQDAHNYMVSSLIRYKKGKKV